MIDDLYPTPTIPRVLTRPRTRYRALWVIHGLILVAGLTTWFFARAMYVDAASIQAEARERFAAADRALVFADRLRKDAEHDAAQAARWRYNAEKWAGEARHAGR